MYNTGNPIGSTAPKDFSDNAEITDRYVNDVVNETTLDRFGRSRLTIHGIEKKAYDVFANLGFFVPVDYTTGLNVDSSNFTVTYNGVVYAAQPSAVPFTTAAWDAAQWYPIQNVLNQKNLLVFGTYAEAQAAAATLPDGQMLDVEQEQSRYKVADRALSFVRRLALGELVRSSGASVVGFLGAESGAVARTVQDKLRDVISAWDFIPPGTNTSTTDCRAYLQAAIDAAAFKRLYIPGGTYKINDQLNLPNYIEIFGDGSATVIKQGAAGMSGFFADTKTDVIVRDLAVLGELVSTSAYTGGVYFYNSVNCAALNVTCIGMTWAGILLNNSSHCSVEGCRFSGWLGTVQDRADICVYQNSNYNIIRGNFCYGGGDHGVMIQDPYTNTTPTGNIVTENEVGEHEAYGIAIYVTTSYDTKTIISNNHVRDIKGTQISGASGAGIFVQSAGGTVVVGNVVDNCCRSTTNFETLGIAAISATMGEYGTGNSSQIVIANNHILALRGPGIYALASDRTIIVEGNTIKSVGVADVRGEAIIASNAQAVKIANNSVYHVNPNYYAVRVTCVGAEYSYHQLVNNTVTSQGGAGGIMINQSGGGFSQYCLVQGNTAWTSNGTPAYFLEASKGMRFVNNHGDSSGVVFSMTDCERSRLAGNMLYSPIGGYSIIFTGTMTGTICDESNDFQGVVQNLGGVIISKYGTAGPASSGYWNVGDRVIQSVPVVGQPKGWRCTVAGNPGTWVSEGNL